MYLATKPSNRPTVSATRRVIAADHLAQVLGVEPSRQRRRTDQVAEHDGDLAPFRFPDGRSRRGGRRFRRAVGQGGDGAQQLLAVAERDPKAFQVRLGQVGQYRGIDIGRDECRGVLGQTERLQPFLDRFHLGPIPAGPAGILAAAARTCARKAIPARAGTHYGHRHRPEFILGPRREAGHRGWIDAVRPSTARFARAQDEALQTMPSKLYLMVRSVPAIPGTPAPSARPPGRAGLGQALGGRPSGDGRVRTTYGADAAQFLPSLRARTRGPVWRREISAHPRPNFASARPAPRSKFDAAKRRQARRCTCRAVCSKISRNG